LQAKRKLREVQITFGQDKKGRLRWNVLNTLVDRAQKRIRGDGSDEGSGDDDAADEPANKRQAILITLWMYCIICFDTSMMKLGITASEDQARDCNASTYYGTCFSKYFPIRVSIVPLSALSSCCPAIFVQWSNSHICLYPSKDYNIPPSCCSNI
jgi:hypothetical protein